MHRRWFVGWQKSLDPPPSNTPSWRQGGWPKPPACAPATRKTCFSRRPGAALAVSPQRGQCDIGYPYGPRALNVLPETSFLIAPDTLFRINPPAHHADLISTAGANPLCFSEETGTRHAPQTSLARTPRCPHRNLLKVVYARSEPRRKNCPAWLARVAPEMQASPGFGPCLGRSTACGVAQG
jgi:hypothetical protein